jgi:hypothetical protein
LPSWIRIRNTVTNTVSGGAKALEQHLKMHTGSRDYKCRLCAKSFINQSRLTHHITTVHEEPKFHCDQCFKTFRSKANFERHQRIHTEEKPFVCQFCGFRCNHATNLNSHVRTIHKEATFTTGKAAKEAKKKNLLKEMLSSKASKLGNEEAEASLLPVSLGLDVLKRLECQGKIVTRLAETPPPQPQLPLPQPQSRRSVVGVRRQQQQQQRQLVAYEKSLIRRNRRSRDQIFTVTNSRGDLVEALVSLDAMDESLSTFSE